MSLLDIFKIPEDVRLLWFSTGQIYQFLLICNQLILLAFIIATFLREYQNPPLPLSLHNVPNDRSLYPEKIFLPLLISHCSAHD